jgi:hypothetical protein
MPARLEKLIGAVDPLVVVVLLVDVVLLVPASMLTGLLELLVVELTLEDMKILLPLSFSCALPIQSVLWRINLNHFSGVIQKNKSFCSREQFFRDTLKAGTGGMKNSESDPSPCNFAFPQVG